MSKCLKQIITLLMGLTLTIAVYANSVVDTGRRYHTATLITDTIKALPQCLRYCLIGIEIRIRYNGYSIEVYFVPRVEHYMSTLHVMTSDYFPREAYLEWAALVGQIQKQLLDNVAQAIPSTLGGSPIFESSGGRSRYGEYGSHQSTNFKEAELMGHPVAILPSLVDKNGDMTADTYTDGETGATDSIGNLGGGSGDMGRFISQWTSWSHRCFTDPNPCSIGPSLPGLWVMQQFNLGEVVQQVISAVKAVGVNFQEIAQTVRRISTIVAGNTNRIGGGIKIDRLLCPNDVSYFFPYYLSGVDALFWRSGWPMTDLRYTTTMLNPLSSDRIGHNGETWAHVYPRHGFVNNDHPGHVAPAIAYRSADLVANENSTLRIKRTTVYAKGDWQNQSPEPTNYCATNIADLPTPIDEGGGYAHNIWTKFTCPLSEVRILVAFVPYRYCF